MQETSQIGCCVDRARYVNSLKLIRKVTGSQCNCNGSNGEKRGTPCQTILYSLEFS